VLIICGGKSLSEGTATVDNSCIWPRCRRAAGGVADRVGASLSGTAGAPRRRFRPGGTVDIVAPTPAV